jgi:hypothetical protein
MQLLRLNAPPYRRNDRLLLFESNNTMKASFLFTAALLSIGASVTRAESCGDYSGNIYIVTHDGMPGLNFAEYREDGVYLNITIPVGQMFQVLGPSSHDTTSHEDTVLTQDGQHLDVSCDQLSNALSTSYFGQRIALAEANAADFSHAASAYKAKQDADEVKARRKHQEAVANRAQEIQAQKEYVEQRLARGGVKIGMTEQQVLASSWGSPDKRNHTITPLARTEQWVYADQYFLYFTDGVLTAIQTDSPDRGYFRVANENSVKNVAPTPQQQNYLTSCNSFAWRGDKVRCEAAADQTLRIYQQGEPPGGDPDADTTKYLINRPDRLRDIKQKWF